MWEKERRHSVNRNVHASAQIKEEKEKARTQRMRTRLLSSHNRLEKQTGEYEMSALQNLKNLFVCNVSAVVVSGRIMARIHTGRDVLSVEQLLWLGVVELIRKDKGGLGPARKPSPGISETTTLAGRRLLSLSSNNTGINNDSAYPRLQSACSKCVGYIKDCDNCGQK